MAASTAITPPPGYALEGSQPTPAPAQAPQQAAASPVGGLPPGYTVEPNSPGIVNQQASPPATQQTDLEKYKAGATDANRKGMQMGVDALTGAGQEAVGMVTGAATHTGIIGAARDVYDKTFNELPPVFKAYEKVRNAGGSLKDALSAANDEAAKQEDARSIFKQRAKEFHENPSKATGKTIMDLIPLIYGGVKGMTAEAAPEVTGETAGEVGTEAAAETPKPGIVKQVLKGKDVAQPEAQATMRGVGDTESPSLREVLSKPIEEAETSKRALYKSYDDAAGVDRKALQERLDNTQEQMSKLTGTAVDMRRLGKLQEAESALKKTISDADAKAEAAGVKISDADAANIKVNALREAEKNVFHNQEVIEGNTAQGGSESVNIDNAIKQIQKMKDNEKFGGPRWDQAFGEGSGDKVLTELRKYQAQGVHALKVQKFAKVIGGLAGLATFGKAVGAAQGAIQ